MKAATIALAMLPMLAHAEPVQLRSAPAHPTPLQQRLARERGTEPAPAQGDAITAELYRPGGPGPFPALVVLHGCAGRAAPADERRRMAHYVAQGYATLVVDSFAPRHIQQACIPGDPAAGLPAASADRIGDAFAALDWLAAQPFVDPARIAALGFSQGGGVALFAASKDGAAQGYAHRFAATVAYYPPCSPAYAANTVPVLVLIGEKDDWTPLYDCQLMLDAHATASPPLTLQVFPAAGHSFDAESLAGHPVDRYLHHLEYNQPAAEAADAAATAFLARALRP